MQTLLHILSMSFVDKHTAASVKVLFVWTFLLTLLAGLISYRGCTGNDRWERVMDRYERYLNSLPETKAMPSWYVVPAIPQIKQATFFQVDTKTLPDLPAVVYVPAFLSLVAALGILWRDSLSTRKRANQKEDERDKNDIETTRVFSGLESVLRNLPDVIDRKIREGFENLRNREH